MSYQNGESPTAGGPGALEKQEKESLSLSDKPGWGEGQGPVSPTYARALELVRAGCSVIPLGAPGEDPPAWLVEKYKGDFALAKSKWPKTPWKKWKQYVHTPPTEADVHSWFRQRPNANIGFPTGGANQVIVVDVDGPKGDAWARENLDTRFTQTTGREGGYHVFYRQAGAKVGNSHKTLAPEIDVRGDGGMVVIEPSVHPSGRVYTLNFNLFDRDALPAWNIPFPETEKGGQSLKREHETVLSDEELVVKARAAKVSLERAFMDGGKAVFPALYDDGDFSKYPSQSEGDLALCCVLAFWSGKDAEQMDRIFRTSALMRDKWDDVHYANGDSYGEGTLKKALAGTTGVYAGQKIQPVKRILRKGYDLAELLDMEFAPVQWVVPGLVASGLSVLSGAPKLGKSWTVLDIALAKASGAQALGYSTPEVGRVLYLALEDVPRRLKKRIETMTALGKIDATSAKRIRFENDWERMDDGGLERLEQYAKDHPDLSLVIIDTWSLFKSIKRSNNNAYEEDYVKVAPLKRFADKVPVILVHHNRKMKTDDIFESMSGSQGLPGAADTLLVMTKKRASTVARLHVVGRDVEDAELALEWNSTTCRWSAVAQVEEVKLTPERQSIVDLLVNTGEPLTPKEIAERLNMKNNSVSFLLGKLVDEAFIIRTGYGRYAAQSAQSTQSAQTTQSTQTAQSSG